MAQLNASIGNDLNQTFEIMFRRNRNAGPIDDLQRAGFVAHLSDAGFQSFVERKQTHFQRLSVGYVVERPPQQGSRTVVSAET